MTPKPQAGTSLQVRPAFSSALTPTPCKYASLSLDCLTLASWTFSVLLLLSVNTWSLPQPGRSVHSLIVPSLLSSHFHGPSLHLFKYKVVPPPESQRPFHCLPGKLSSSPSSASDVTAVLREDTAPCYHYPAFVFKTSHFTLLPLHRQHLFTQALRPSAFLALAFPTCSFFWGRMGLGIASYIAYISLQLLI